MKFRIVELAALEIQDAMEYCNLHIASITQLMKKPLLYYQLPIKEENHTTG